MNEETKRAIAQVEHDLLDICHIWDAALHFLDFCRPAPAMRVLEAIILGHQAGMRMKYTPWSEFLMLKTSFLVMDKIAANSRDFDCASKCFPEPEACMDLIIDNVEQTPEVMAARGVLEELTLKQRYEIAKTSLSIAIARGEAEFTS